jgi:hypothetical protein
MQNKVILIKKPFRTHLNLYLFKIANKIHKYHPPHKRTQTLIYKADNSVRK